MLFNIVEITYLENGCYTTFTQIFPGCNVAFEYTHNCKLSHVAPINLSPGAIICISEMHKSTEATPHSIWNLHSVEV